MIIRFLLSCVLALLLSAAPAFAVNPDEILGNPQLEQRARDISANLRCLVCQNQSIDDSDAELARDLRVIVRERLVSGDTDAQVMDYVVDRYGEFVLLRPAFSARNILLWGTPIFVLILGGVAAFAYSRRYSSSASGPVSLTHEEEERLNKLLDDEDDK
ncbi:cytochrome c-type biogenesis protein [Ahrensia kielensis]|uniref:Cytochrome c-type biogenesis protein n=1 Tax=Ahrensia kielensis TaxID=76980 RepID=A0ABU9T8C9_9HYPH